jgi:hypothetical protein
MRPVLQQQTGGQGRGGKADHGPAASCSGSFSHAILSHQLFLSSSLPSHICSSLGHPIILCVPWTWMAPQRSLDPTSPPGLPEKLTQPLPGHCSSQGASGKQALPRGSMTHTRKFFHCFTQQSTLSSIPTCPLHHLSVPMGISYSQPGCLLFLNTVTHLHALHQPKYPPPQHTHVHAQPTARTHVHIHLQPSLLINQLWPKVPGMATGPSQVQATLKTKSQWDV